MPKRIRSRNIQGFTQMTYISGHTNEIGDEIDAVIEATTIYTTNSVIQNIKTIEFIDQAKIPEITELTVEQENILKKNGVLDGTNNNAIDLVNESIETINNSLNIVVQETTNYYSADNYGLPMDVLKELYQKFIYAYANKGPCYLPPVGEFQKFFTLICEAKEAAPTDFRLDMYHDMLNILIQSRTVYFENIKLNAEVCSLRNYKSECKAKISELMSEIARLTGDGSSGSYFSGKLGIKLKKPKRLIYAQALLNINMAWYIYLHNTAKVCKEEFISTVAYVETLGPEAYDTLIKLLDEKYACLDDLMDEIEDQLDICSVTDTTCTDTNTSCNKPTACGTDIPQPCDTPKSCSTPTTCVGPWEQAEMYKKMFYNVAGSRALALPGCMSIQQSDKIKNTRKYCKPPVEKCSSNTTCKNTSSHDSNYVKKCYYSYIGPGQRALKLCGSMKIRTSEKVNSTRKCSISSIL